jgi:tRNA-specific 2-thiouridylase
MKRMHITIGLSGGVDSSVAAWFLKKQGHKVDAIFMKNWDDEINGACNSKEDFLSAAVAAEKLDIPLEHVSFSEEYKKAVFNDFLEEYANGKTPNPDVFCNSEIKFKAFLNYSKKLGSEMIATGHYAQSQKAKKKNKYQIE